MTTGEIAAHFADIYGVGVSKDTISRITDKVISEMAEWCKRPLESVQLTRVARMDEPPAGGVRRCA